MTPPGKSFGVWMAQGLTFRGGGEVTVDEPGALGIVLEYDVKS